MDISNSADFAAGRGLCARRQSSSSLATPTALPSLGSLLRRVAWFFRMARAALQFAHRLRASLRSRGLADLRRHLRESMDFRCIQAWGLDHTLIGQGTGGSEVGLAVGQHLVYTSAASIAAPSVVTRVVPTGRFTGVPGANTVASSYSDTADAKSHSSSTGLPLHLRVHRRGRGLARAGLAQASVIGGRPTQEIPFPCVLQPGATSTSAPETPPTRQGPAVIVRTSLGLLPLRGVRGCQDPDPRPPDPHRRRDAKCCRLRGR